MIEMNESKLHTIAQIREFLTGASDVTFSIPSNESRLRDFIVTVITRFRYFRLTKGHRGVLFTYYAALDRLFPAASIAAGCTVSRYPIT